MERSRSGDGVTISTAREPTTRAQERVRALCCMLYQRLQPKVQASADGAPTESEAAAPHAELVCEGPSSHTAKPRRRGPARYGGWRTRPTPSGNGRSGVGQGSISVESAEQAAKSAERQSARPGPRSLEALRPQALADRATSYQAPLDEPPAGRRGERRQPWPLLRTGLSVSAPAPLPQSAPSIAQQLRAFWTPRPTTPHRVRQSG